MKKVQKCQTVLPCVLFECYDTYPFFFFFFLRYFDSSLGISFNLLSFCIIVSTGLIFLSLNRLIRPSTYWRSNQLSDKYFTCRLVFSYFLIVSYLRLQLIHSNKMLTHENRNVVRFKLRPKMKVYIKRNYIISLKIYQA